MAVAPAHNRSSSISLDSASFSRFVTESREGHEKLGDAVQQLSSRLNILVSTFTTTIASLSGHYNSELTRLSKHCDKLNVTLQNELNTIRARCVKLYGNLGPVDVGSLDSTLTLLGSLHTQQDVTVHGSLTVHNDKTNTNRWSVDVDGNMSVQSIMSNQPVSVAFGGTGLSSISTGQLLCGTDTQTFTAVPANTIVGKKYLTQTGTGGSAGIPSWQILSGTDVVGDISGKATNVSGRVAIANGGTNSSAALNNNRIMMSSNGAIVEAAGLLLAQVLAGTASGATAVTTLTGTTHQVIITTSNGRIVFALPQDLGTASTVTFAALFVDALNAGSSGVLDLGGNSSVVQLGCGTGTQVVNIGSSGGGTTTINLGGPEDIINIGGTAIYNNVTNTTVTDNTFILNRNGSAGSAGGSGLLIEEGGLITAFVKLNSTRTAWELQAPEGGVIVTLNQPLQTSDSVVFNALSLTTPLDRTSGGTGFASYTLGDLLCGGISGTLSKLPGKTLNGVKYFLTQTGTGSASALPVWLTLQASDLNGILPVANGGTGKVSFGTAAGGLMYTSSTTVLDVIPAVATGNVLLSNGINTQPIYGKVNLTTHTTGSVSVGAGGTGFTTYTVGNMLYASAAAVLSKIAPNTTTIRKFLRQVGTGTVASAPLWDILDGGDISGDINSATVGGQSATAVAAAATAVAAATSTMTGNTLIKRDTDGNFAANNASLSSLTLTTALSPVSGGTGLSFFTIGSMLYASNATTLAAVTPNNTASRLFLLQTASGAPWWSQIKGLDVSGNIVGLSSGFTTSLTGDVTGGANGTNTEVALVGGKMASDVANAVTTVETATSSNTPSTLVRRDGSGAFAAGAATLTAATISGATSLLSTLSVNALSTLNSVNISGSISAATWGISGIQWKVSSSNCIDTSSPAGSTVTSLALNALGASTVAAAQATATNKVTYTNSSTLYIAGAPLVGLNTLITNPMALNVASGLTNLGGGATVVGSIKYLNSSANNNGVTVSAPPMASNSTFVLPTVPTIMPTMQGTADSMLVNNGVGVTSWQSPKELYTWVLKDVKLGGGSGGNYPTATTWMRRTLNTTFGGIPGASLNTISNQFTLPAGTFTLNGSAPCYAGGPHQIRIRNMTDATILVDGTPEFPGSGGGAGQSRSFVSHTFTLAGAKVLQLEHWMTNTGNDRLGRSTANGSDDVYGMLTFITFM